MFPSGFFDISDRYNTAISTAYFSSTLTWMLSYLAQGALLILNIIAIFKKNNLGRLYQSPPILTIYFHIAFFFNFCFNIAWLYVWVNGDMNVSSEMSNSN